MAGNALLAQLRAVCAASARFEAGKSRDILAALVTTASLVYEATQLAKANMRTLRPLAMRTKVTPKVLSDFGKLCAGKHGSSDVLKRVRNRLGFHWDADEIAPSVLNVSKKEKLVWLESSSHSDPVYRLAFEVLAHALVSEESEPAATKGVARPYKIAPAALPSWFPQSSSR